jgi:hypothetical protein
MEKDLPGSLRPGRVGKEAGRAVQVIMKVAGILKKSPVGSLQSPVR